MRHVRIRWRNVARFVGALAALVVALFAAPALLAPPEPAPLPDDVGLEAGATGFVYEAPEEQREPRPNTPEPRREPKPRPERPAPRHEHVEETPRKAAAPAPVTPPPPVPAPAPSPIGAPAPPPTPAAPPAPSSPVKQEFGFEP
jgi:outer membrane biosynthesis protein TonB